MKDKINGGQMKLQSKEIIWFPYPENKPKRGLGDFLVIRKTVTGRRFVECSGYINDRFTIEDDFVIAFAEFPDVYDV